MDGDYCNYNSIRNPLFPNNYHFVIKEMHPSRTFGTYRLLIWYIKTSILIGHMVILPFAKRRYEIDKAVQILINKRP